MDGTELPPIPPLALHGGIRKDDINPQSIVEKWLGELEALFTDKSHNKVSELLIDDCWWRDMVGLDWDFTSKHGHKAISEYLSRSLHGISDLQTIDSTGLKPFVVEIGPMTWIQAGFNFKTPHGQGRGFVRLTNVEKDSWKAWTVFTQLERLNYQDELDTTMLQRASAHTAQVIATNNKETSNSNSTEEQSDLQVLIVGAGGYLSFPQQSCTESLTQLRTSWPRTWCSTEAHGHIQLAHRSKCPSWRLVESEISIDYHEYPYIHRSLSIFKAT